MLNIYAYIFYICTFKIYSEEIICCETHWSVFIQHTVRLKNKTFGRCDWVYKFLVYTMMKIMFSKL